jgi:hypothetical protein
MDRVLELENLVIDVLGEYRDYLNRGNGTPVQLIIDRDSKHYQLVMIGWESQKRHFGVLVHLCIKNGKVNLEYNGTEENFLAQLEERGAQKLELVVAFRSPLLRSMTEYAVE